MALESATFIDDLVATNPVGGDAKSQGDDHIRLVKSVLKASFPSITRAFNLDTWAEKSSSVLAKTAAYTIVAADDGKLIDADATAAAFTVTLPAAASSAGFVLGVKKTDSSANAVTVDGNVAETIDGATTKVLAAQNDFVMMFCDGVEWFIVAETAAVADGSITAAKLATDAVTTVKINASAVTAAKIGTSAVTTAKINANAVTGPKIAMGSDAKGDVLAYNGTDYVRRAVGTNGQVLTADSAQADGVKWAAGFDLSSPDYAPAEQTVSINTVLNLAHGLAIPKLYIIDMRCKTADLGHVAGDEVAVFQSIEETGAEGLSISKNATNITIKTGGTINIMQGSGAKGAITVASWKWVVRAWV